MENEEEVIAPENDTETTENEEQELDKKPEVDAEKEELKKRLKTAEAQKDHWRKKASEKKESKEETSSTGSLDTKDLLALTRADVHEDDIDEVVDYAKFKGISVSEALSSDVVKTLLSNKKEFRKTAEVTNTGTAKKGSVKVTDDTLLKNLSDGKIPESREEAERLFWARRGGKR